MSETSAEALRRVATQRARRWGADAVNPLRGSGAGGPGRRTPPSRGGRHRFGWLIAGTLVIIAAVVAPITVLTLVPPTSQAPYQTSPTCGAITNVGAPPGGAAVPGTGSVDNPGGPPVTDPYLGVPSSFEQLNPTQLGHAKTIVDAARQVGANDKAVVIALMTAMVETHLLNIASGVPSEAETKTFPNDGVSSDHLSAGMFQQQPWWGTAAERMDVAKSTQLFLQGGRDGAPGLFSVSGWEQMPSGTAAQTVQRSAYGGKYAEFEETAQRVLVKVAGDAGTPITAPVGCGPNAYGKFPPPPPEIAAMLQGVQPDTLLVAGAVASQFNKIKVYGGVRDDALPDHPSGRALDIMVSSAFGDIHSPEAVKYGTDIAELVKNNADALGVDYIIWNAHIWSSKRAGEGWRECGGAGGGCYNGPDDTAAHRDHVHVTTYGNSAQSRPMPVVGGGKATAPLPDGTFTVNHSFGKSGAMWSSKHTGEDFAAAQGTPVLSVMDGMVVQSIGDGWAGNNVVIAHPGGIHTLYAHLSAIDAPPGTQVRAGQPVGKVGQTGNAKGAHLHMEYYPAGLTPGRDIYKAQDPIPFLQANGVQV